MGKKILVVEDDFDTRYVLSLILRTEGYEVVTAADGECALTVAQGERPDLIITDISMPRLNGVELKPGLLTPLAPGDELLVGMWTRLQLRRR